MATHKVAKVIEIVGSSPKGWSEAADVAVQVANKSVNHISGVHVGAMTAQVKDGKIHTYKTTLKIAFGIED